MKKKHVLAIPFSGGQSHFLLRYFKSLLSYHAVFSYVKSFQQSRLWKVMIIT